jgi:hypothetical protein
MANTYTLIASNVLTTGASSITFTAIPQTYTDLVVRLSARCDAASVDRSLGIRPNSLTTGDSNTSLSGDGSAATSGRATTDFDAGRFTGASATADTFGSVEIYIPNYTVAQNKPMSVFGVAETNATAVTMRINALLWSNTAEITELKIDTDTAPLFVAGSSFYLYGIKNS